MHILLLSTYELGRQPFGLASPAAWLREAGFDVACRDLSQDRLDEAAAAAASLIAVHLPMHTAARLALPVIERVRALNPGAHLCAYGLYAAPNAELFHARGVHTVLGPEFEADLVALAQGLRRPDGPAPAHSNGPPALPRLSFRVPDRSGLSDTHRYASVQLPSGERRLTGYTEASRGCKHLCRHCPVVPVYNGRFRIVAPEVVAADLAAQVARGARHITFGDPDFFNGIRHARRVVESLAAAHPGVSYDVTIKIEHLLRHRDALPLLRDTGCLFVTSAVEAVDDGILEKLEKGHTRADFERVVDLMREVGLPLAPTFVAFTPWTSVEAYAQLLETVDALTLVEAVAPIQLALRLLIPAGSRLLELPDVRSLVGPWEAAALAFPWTHPDPAADALQRDVMRLVGRRLAAPRQEVFRAVCERTESVLGRPIGMSREPRPARVTVPYLTEPWYC